MNEFINLNHVDADVTVNEIAYIYHKIRNSGFLFSKPSRDYYTIAFVLSGQAEYHLPQSSFVVKTGDILFLDKNISYSAKVISEAPWEHFVISFKAENMESLPVQIIHKTSHGNRFEDLFREAYSTWSGCAAAYKIKTKAIVTRILYELVLENVSKLFGSNMILKKVTDYIEENYAQKITIEDLTALSGYSASHFAREFRKTYGVSPIQYLNHIRITHAKNLMRAGQHSVTQIAQKCGFSNVYYFSAYFKKITGITPRDY